MKISKDRAEQLKKDLGASELLYSTKDATFARLSARALRPVSINEEIEKSETATFEKGTGAEKTNKFIFRMLSAQSAVQQVYDFTEIPFKDIVDKFDNKKLMKDHSYGIDNIIGKTYEAFYDESGEYPGISTKLEVSSRYEEIIEKIHEGLIDSGSVGIYMQTKKSHEFEDAWDFYYLLGHEVDGSIVRFIVTEIDEITEFSLVWAGADKYAKRQFSEEHDKDVKHFAELLEIKAGLEKRLEESEASVQELKEASEKMKEELEAATYDLAFLSVAGVSVESLKQVMEYADLGRRAFNEMREAAKLSAIQSGFKDDVLVGMIEKASSYDELKSLKAVFDKRFEQKYPEGQVSESTVKTEKVSTVNGIRVSENALSGS